MKKFFILISIAILIAGSSFALVIYFLNPDDMGFVAFLLLYITLFTAIMGMGFLASLLIRHLAVRDERILMRHMGRALHQGIVIGILAVISALLVQFRVMAWWGVFLVISLGMLLEGMIYSKRSLHRHEYVRNSLR